MVIRNNEIFVHYQEEYSDFPVAELEKYLKAILPSEKSDKKNKSDIMQVYIGDPDWCERKTGVGINKAELLYDGFYLNIDGSRVIIGSSFERGMLYGVYEFLERAGCRWYYPGQDGEFIPKSEEIIMQDGEWHMNPDFEIRGFTEGTHKKPVDAWIEEMLETIDWMSKNKCNSIFIHNDPGEPVQGWDVLLPEMKKRDMIIEIGGHGVQNFVNRDLFESKPYLFREKNGERKNDGNFCVSSDEAVAMVVDRVRSVLLANPGVDVLHLWFDDVAGGSWCDCAKCHDIPATSQLMKVITAVSADLKKSGGKTRIDTLLYHDTLNAESPDGGMPDNIFGFYAPRERCYAHGIGEKECARNVFYHEKLTDVVRTFGKNTYIFEYYDDIILYLKMKTNIPETIKDDLVAYKAAGVNKITSLMFGRYSWLAYEFNMLAFAKLSWDLKCDYTELQRNMCADLYPVCSDAVHDYYQKLEMASFYMFAFDGYIDDVNDIRNLRIQPLEYFEKHVEYIRKSHDLYGSCAEIISECMRNPGIGAEEKRRLELQDIIIDISVKESLAVYFQMKSRMLKAQGNADIPDLERMMDDAMEIETKMEEWIKSIPLGIKGVAGGESIFEKHLCNDMFRIYRSMKRGIMA